MHFEIKNSVLSITFLSSHIESARSSHTDIVFNKLTTNEKSLEKTFTTSYPLYPPRVANSLFSSFTLDKYPDFSISYNSI